MHTLKSKSLFLYSNGFNHIHFKEILTYENELDLDLVCFLLYLYLVQKKYILKITNKCSTILNKVPVHDTYI